MSQVIVLAWAFTIVSAFIAGFGSCLMLLHRDRKEPM